MRPRAARSSALPLVPLGLLVLLFVVLAGSPGCGLLPEPRIADDAGNKLTLAEWISKENKDQRAIEDAAAKKINAANTAARKAQIDATLKAADITAQADGDAAKAKRQLAALAVTTGATVDAAVAEAAAASATVQSQVRALRDSTDFAIQQIDAQKQQATGLVRALTSLPIVGQAMATVGITPDKTDDLTKLLFGGASVGLFAWRSKKNADKAYDDGAAERAATEAKAYDDGKREHQATADAARLQLLSLLVSPASLASLLPNGGSGALTAAAIAAATSAAAATPIPSPASPAA